MNSQDSQVLQQRDTATKRPRDAEGEVDGPLPKKANVEHDTIDGYRRKQADLSECCTIEAIFRTGRITRRGSGGTLLKAQSDEEVKLSVDFTGTGPNIQASVFYLESCKGIVGHVLRYSLKDVNYYLRVYSRGRVRLRRLEDFPTKNKYFFRIQPVGSIVGCPLSFKSLNTDEYLCCDEDGKAFMEKLKTDSKRKPKDQRAWFCCQKNGLDSELGENPVTDQSKNERDLVDGETEDSENGNSEAPGEGHPDVLEEGNSKDPEEGGYQYPVHLHTGDEWGAGTDAIVVITIFGEDGDSGEKTLDNSNNNFERGGKDSFTVTCGTYLGRLTQIKIDHDNSGLWAAWFLDKVTVQDPTTGEEVNFSCRRWFSTSDDDGKISRVLTRDDDKGEVDMVDGPQAKDEYDTIDGSKVAFSECCSVQAIIRTDRITRGGSDGNLLKAQSDGEVKLSVDFTGTDQDNQPSVFYLEAQDGIAAVVLRYSLKDDNYYLRVYSNSKVKLRKLEDFPTNNKYLFCVQRSGRSVRCPVSFKSLNTDEYLCCDEHGNAFMEKVKTDSKRNPKDIQALFRVHKTTQKGDPVSQLEKYQAALQYKNEQDLVDGGVEDSENENSEAPGEGHPDVLEEGNTNDLEEEAVV